MDMCFINARREYIFDTKQHLHRTQPKSPGKSPDREKSPLLQPTLIRNPCFLPLSFLRSKEKKQGPRFILSELVVRATALVA